MTAIRPKILLLSFAFVLGPIVDPLIKVNVQYVDCIELPPMVISID